jgi:outer membrane protein assembly factor BamA
MLRIVFVLLFFNLALSFSLNAQEKDRRSYYLLLEKGEKRKAVLQAFDKEKFDDLQKLRKGLREAISSLQAAGFLTARLDSTSCQAKQCSLYLKAGPQYRWAMLENGNLASELLDEVGYKDPIYQNKVFRYKQVADLQEKLLDYCENHGYPFAKVWLDSIQGDSLLSARLYLDYGPAIQMDSIQVEQQKGSKKTVRISKRYLQQYLGLQQGSVYDERQIQKIKKRLKELPFLGVYRDPYILFIGEKARPVLFLENRNASKFDILFGVLPNTNALPQEPNFRFTGNVQIDLLNPFGTGKRLLAHWQQYEQGRSEMRFAFWYPYILRTPLGVDLKFNIYRRDSTYIDIISDVGLQYLFDGNNYIKAFWKNTTTNVQQIDSNYILQNRRLPPLQDLRNAVFGLEYYFQRLNYRWNPRKGFSLKATAGFGLKSIRQNTTVLGLTDPNEPSFDFSSLYDSINRRSFQYSFELDYAHFIPTSMRSTLMGRYRTGWIYAPQNQIYTNELYRIGGNQLMRGFDEQSLFTSWYNVLTLEWRYLIGTNSYAYLFGDGSYLERRNTDDDWNNWLYGFGVGVALETPVGIFGLSYALGTSIDQPIIIRNGKIHFGYVNIF